MVQFDSRAVIGLRPPDSRPRIPGPVTRTTVHYNGPAMHLLDKPHTHCRAAWRGIQNYHMNNRGFDDIAYTMGVCPHGIILAGRGAGVRSAANGTKTGNDTSYAIMGLIGEGESPTREMYYGVKWAAQGLDVPALIPHSYWKPTGCPGNPFRTWIAQGAPVENNVDFKVAVIATSDVDEGMARIYAKFNQLKFLRWIEGLLDDFTIGHAVLAGYAANPQSGVPAALQARNITYTNLIGANRDDTARLITEEIKKGYRAALLPY